MSTTLFNDAAALCDQARPGYPEEALDAIVEMAGLVGDERAPEVGCGTGRVTIPFARRGYAILALEPGDALAGIAAARCRSFPDVRIEETRMAGRGGRLRSGRVGAGVSRDRSLPEPNRTSLFREIAMVIERMEDAVTRRFETVALVARKKDRDTFRLPQRGPSIYICPP